MDKKPPEFSEEEAALIAEIMDRADFGPGSWQLDELATLKRTLKASAIRRQERRCPYCDQFYPTYNHKNWEIDHVVPRSTHRQWMFEPFNMVVACSVCNASKSDKNVFLSRATKKLPTESNKYAIIHPYIDKYERHIRRKGNAYTPKTAKGIKTVEVFNLHRFSIARYDELYNEQCANGLSPEEATSAADKLWESEDTCAALTEELMGLIATAVADLPGRRGAPES